VVYSVTAERDAIERMEPRWRRLGYTVVRDPGPDQLPAFLQGFQLDAIATGAHPNLAIEVKRSRAANVEAQLRPLRALLEGREDWRLEVIYSAPEETQPEPQSREEIRSTLDAARSLSAIDSRAGLLLAWAALEAAARDLEPELADRSLSTASLIDLLVSTGHVLQEEGANLRRAAQTRNAVAHGQLDLEPDRGDLDLLMDIGTRLAA
jgi:hypothetical protein